jgi:hypothetical protein
MVTGSLPKQWNQDTLSFPKQNKKILDFKETRGYSSLLKVDTNLNGEQCAGLGLSIHGVGM